MCNPQKGRGQVEPPTNFQQMGGEGLTGPQLLEGVAGKEGVTFFKGEGCKLKSEIFNDKNSL